MRRYIIKAPVVSLNKIWQTGRSANGKPYQYLAPKALAWKNTIAWALRQQDIGRRRMDAERYAVAWCWMLSNPRRDLDNCGKIAQDTLAQHLGIDDNMTVIVATSNVGRVVPKKEEGVIIAIRAATPADIRGPRWAEFPND